MRLTLYEPTRLGYAYDRLVGLAAGEALRARAGQPLRRPGAGSLPPPVWEWTDDTEMACSVYWMLREAGGVERDRLAAAFAERCEPNRGHGVGALPSCAALADIATDNADFHEPRIIRLEVWVHLMSL
jgi:hypothetical protein